MLPPLSWVALSFISGLVIAEIINIPPTASWSVAAGTILLGIILSLPGKRRLWPVRKHTRIGVPPLLLLISCAFGVIRIQLATLPVSQEDLSWYNEKGFVTIRGQIISYPDRRDTYQLLTMASRKISAEGYGTNISISGRAIIRVGIDKSWAYGDEISFTGRLITPSNEADYSYRDYLAHHSIHSAMYYPEMILISSKHGIPPVRWIYSLRDKGLVTLSHIFPMPESALLSGILLGVDNDIPADIQASFRATGTTHIIAISGFNISILAALFSSIFYRFFGARKGALMTIIALLIYVLLSGGSPSVIRAAIMGCLGLFANLVGRRQVGLNTLAFVAAIMCLFNPFLPWDISFQLSFLSTLGLILFAEPMVNWLKKIFTRYLPHHSLESLAEKIGEYCLFTFAALITTFPVMAFHFHSLSWLSLITNPLILPAQPLVMILGGLSVLFGLFWLPLGQFFAYLAWPFVAYTIRLVEWFGNLADNNQGALVVGMGFIILYYLVLGICCVNQRMVLIKRILQPNLIIIVCMAMTTLLWRVGMSLPDGKLHVYLIENGDSENLLIHSPEGRFVLLNAGSQSTNLADALGKRMPPGTRDLDVVFLPVSDKQAVRSLRRGSSGISIGTLTWLGDPSNLATVRDLEGSIDAQEISSTNGPGNLVYKLSSEASLTYQPVQKDNGIFTLSWRDFRMLIPVHIDNATWLDMVLAQDPPCCYNVILLAGNGNPDLNPPSLLRSLNPMLTLIISSSDKSMDMPLPLIRSGTLLTTRQNGWVHIITDGHHLWVETERGLK